MPFVEPTPRRIRVRLADELVACSDHAQLLVQYGPGGLPTYYLPLTDVVPDTLVDESTGTDGRRTWAVQVDGRRVQAAAWTHPDPTGPLCDLAGLVTFSWRQLEWYEEDERALVHARDPYKRVDTLRSSRRVQVLVSGTEVANSTRPLILLETGLPTRYYVPASDVDMQLLEASDTVSSCPYKGRARYWSVRAGDTLVPDAVWSYPDPIPENPRIRDLLCFFNERVDLVVDGQRLERAQSQWSEPDADREVKAELRR